MRFEVATAIVSRYQLIQERDVGEYSQYAVRSILRDTPFSDHRRTRNNAPALSQSCASAVLLLNDKIKMSITLVDRCASPREHSHTVQRRMHTEAHSRCASFRVWFRFFSAPNRTQMHTISNRLFLSRQPFAALCLIDNVDECAAKM